jgi:hypothetical protein
MQVLSKIINIFHELVDLLYERLIFKLLFFGGKIKPIPKKEYSKILKVIKEKLENLQK